MKNRASDYMLYKRRFFEDIMGNLNLEKDYEEIFKENAKKLDELQENIKKVKWVCDILGSVIKVLLNVCPQFCG